MAFFRGRKVAAHALIRLMPPDVGHMATGATLRAALAAVRRQGAAQIGVALPVALGHSPRQLPVDVAPVVCPYPHADVGGVGAAYDHFPQVGDCEVAQLLSKATVPSQA